ncbi:M56 family metallopeptidase [Flavobacterium sp. JP2137]|uniref:M56 family metallopeptidase n=1 Tax=Flavobacterium sp. JP2137 TaxID=3414510 RepID=UPI003D2FC918
MEALYLYLFKANLLLTLFYILYKILLQPTTFYTQNRYYFLSGLLLSLLMPLWYFSQTVWITADVLDAPIAALPSVAQDREHPLDFALVISGTIAATALVLLTRLLLKIRRVHHLSTVEQPLIRNGIRYYDQVEYRTPFSFWNSIYYNSRNYSEAELEVILLHEKVHIDQKHTVDILILQLLCCLFWFNPWMWKLKTAAIANLEFLTDEAVLQQSPRPVLYQKTLLKTVGIPLKTSITPAFNQSFIKTRIMKINQSKTQKIQAVRYGFPLAAVVVFTLLFQVKIVAQVKTPNSPPNTAVAPPMPPQIPAAVSEPNDSQMGTSNASQTAAAIRDNATAIKDLENAKKDTKTAAEAIKEAKIDMQTAKSDLEAAKADIETAKRDLETAKKDIETAKRDVETAKKDIEAAKRDVETATNQLGTKVLTSKDKRTNTALTKRDILALTQAKDAATNARKIALSQVEANQKHLEEARIAASNARKIALSQVEANQKQLEEARVAASHARKIALSQIETNLKQLEEARIAASNARKLALKHIEASKRDE